jgi:transcriptional regulator with XRE-family HTH domain
MTNPAFTDFLREEQRRRDFESIRQFAAWLGLSSSIVWQVMDGQRDPGLEFLIAVANRTGVSLVDLVELARPGALSRADLSLDARVMAQQIEALPDDVRTVVRAIIRGAAYGEKRKDRQQPGDG